MKKLIKVGMVQMSCTEKTEDNLNKAILGINETIEKGAKIICLQELFLTEYFCHSENDDNFLLAEPINGPTVKSLASIAKEKAVVIIVPIFEKRASGLYYNTAVVIDADGSISGYYRKMHLPDDTTFREKYYFTPSDSGYKVFNTQNGKVGVLICWDQWFPEAARLTSLMGADIIFIPTAIGWGSFQDEETNNMQFKAWRTIQLSHAIANGIHLVCVNRVGNEQNDNMIFWGGSFIANPFGNILYEASTEQEDNSVTEIDFQ